MAPAGAWTLPRLPQPSAEESPSHVPGLRLPPRSYRRCYGYESLSRIKSVSGSWLPACGTQQTALMAASPPHTPWVEGRREKQVRQA